MIVQEMLSPDYAGVLFTRDPVSGEEKFVTEYVEGLAENLVGGEVTPQRIEWQPGESPAAPFDIKTLTDLAEQAEKVFGCPQDVEWAQADSKMWLIQARPITTTATKRQNFDLGEPEELFYWGPSRATVRYMSDFMAAFERFFLACAASNELPNPPKTFGLFRGGKVVFLINAASYSNFTLGIFDEFFKQDRLERDLAAWRKATEELTRLTGKKFDEKIVDAWLMTEFAEFALYGAEKAIAAQLARFDERTKLKIRGAFSTPDKPTFLNLLDEELAKSRNVAKMAKKYPWIRDGYGGPNDEAEWYFAERLKAIDENGLIEFKDQSAERKRLAAENDLSEKEIAMLNLARHLAEFMDERKEWMMKTRRSIERPLIKIESGWFFDGRKITSVGQDDVEAIWERYIDFRSASSAVSGMVANTGGRHFISGEVAVLHAHTDPMADDKILVVPSTSPGWVPLMRRARALVTDHGGVMSHAAIVAREFGLPCIVGTKNGTKVLRDGDKIVLNLVTGEIDR